MTLCDDRVSELLEALRSLNAQQVFADAWGDSEVPWYLWRDRLEDILGLERGALDRQPDEDDLPRWKPSVYSEPST